jgi:2-polyprenyl-3-methyl-5-hydroxy-6-metoxy-1,4-benzoquinol methylase
MLDYKVHWEKVYATKTPEEVSWTQAHPKSSLKLIQDAAKSKESSIIDIGGGDSVLVDYLLVDGYTDITVLDISKHALDRAARRLGEKASLVNWIESDIRDFSPKKSYALWHDRAVFHFLTEPEDIQRYLDLVSHFVTGDLILATFSNEGPKRCSGLEVKQYDIKSLCSLFDSAFDLVESFTEDHITPFDTKQNFLFARFKRRQSVC